MDYTVVKLGTEMDGGIVKTCPECGKPGLAIDDLAVGKTYYTHSQSITGTVASVGEATTTLDWHMVDLEPTPPASD